MTAAAQVLACTGITAARALIPVGFDRISRNLPRIGPSQGAIDSCMGPTSNEPVAGHYLQGRTFE